MFAHLVGIPDIQALNMDPGTSKTGGSPCSETQAEAAVLTITKLTFTTWLSGFYGF